MQALEFILSMRPAVPFSIEKGCQEATNSEIRRWLKSKAIVINGETPDWNDEIVFPVTQLVFFPKSARRKTTLF